MHNNTETFIEYFGKIEVELSKLSKEKANGNHTPFYEKLEKAKNNSAVVSRYMTQLKTFGDLRNLIAHNNNRNVAIPTEQTVNELKKIYNLMTNPPKAYDMAHKEVISFEKEAGLELVLETIKKEHYSQFPIYKDGNFEGLLTENGITYWLSTMVEDDVISLKDTKVEEVMVNDEKRKNYKFINRNMDIYEIEHLFNDIKPEALFVTEHGKEEQKILGIITGWDILLHRE